jgi:hypothetical protein
MYVPVKSTVHNLNTNLTFTVLDFRGRNSFPNTQEGLVFQHNFQKKVRDGYITKTFLVRTDNTGWRVDYLALGPVEAVYGPNGESHFKTNEAAAAALETHLSGETC